MSRKFLPEPNMEPRPGFVVHYSDETYLHYEDLCTWSFQRIIGGYPGVVVTSVEETTQDIYGWGYVDLSGLHQFLVQWWRRQF